MNHADNLNSFIQEQLDIRQRHYQENPSSIVEHFNIEQSNIEAYNGRQLLEMIQNADDACEKASDKKLLIQLVDNQLIIANNGEPFSKAGFESIINSNLSPKTMLQNQIGQKGLGFRSILSWADKVTIQSGTTCICFSPLIARAFLKSLKEKKTDLDAILKSKSKEAYPIATLRVPKLLENSDLSEFTTIITLQLKRAILSDVQKQINTIISKETMLFLNHIETIEIQSPKRKVIFEKIVKSTIIQQAIEDSLITINEYNLMSDDTESRTWNVKRFTGTHQNKKYALAIAWNEDLADTINTLFSFFKTEVRFPFPALVHGTFELSPDRNQLVNDTHGHNSFLVTQLVALILKVATEIADKQLIANYLPLQFLQIDFENIDHIFKTFKFKEQLLDQIKQSKILPNVNGNYFADTFVYYNYPISNFLKGEDVPLLMPVCENEKVVKFLENLDKRYYKIEYFISILVRRINTINIEDLSKLFYHLLTYEKYKNTLNSKDFVLSSNMRCLIDNSNQLIESEHVFIYPQQESQLNLPDIIDIRFVNKLLVKYLLQAFDRKEHDVDFIVEQLKPFKVKKYNFIEVAKTLVQMYKEWEQNEANIKELHQYLFGLYKNEFNAPILDKEKDKVLLTIPLIALNSSVRPASTMYFGKAYGHDLTEKLYDFDKSKIIALPQIYDFEDNIELLKKYFKWLGVAELPRYSIKNIETDKSHPFFQHTLKHLKYPCYFYGEPYSEYNTLNNWINRSATIKVGEFDQLEQILPSTSITTIFQWINADKNLKETLENDKEILVDCKLDFYIEKKWNPTSIHKKDISSYTKWQFANYFLLPVESDAKTAVASKCCLSKTISVDFSPFIEKPKIDFTRISKITTIPEDTLENYLVFIGVHREIKTFSTYNLYQILIDLYEKDKDGKVAKSIYGEMVRNFDDNKIDKLDINYNKYLSEGHILCQIENRVAYRPIQNVYYIDKKIWSDNVLKRFPLACIEKKRGNLKIKNLFGVKPLDKISFKIMGKPNLHPLNDGFQTEIHLFKAFMYALRIGEDTKQDIKRAFVQLDIKLVQTIEARFKHEESESPFEMNAFEFISVDKHFYIYIPATIHNMSDLKQNFDFAGSIAEIFTSLLGVEAHQDFIVDFYTLNEFRREERLLRYMQEDTNAILHQAKAALDVMDDLELSFWRAFSIASDKNIEMNLKNDSDVNTFLQAKLQIEAEKERTIWAERVKHLDKSENQKEIYDLFLRFNVDSTTFERHFSGLDWTFFFKEAFIDIKNQYLNDFSWLLYERCIKKPTEQVNYFSSIKQYEAIEYEPKDGFLKNIEDTFKTKVNKLLGLELQDMNNKFSYKEKISEGLNAMSIPTALVGRIDIQESILFDRKEMVEKHVQAYEARQKEIENQDRVQKQEISIRGNKICFKKDDYEELAEQYLQNLDISALQLKKGVTAPIEVGKSRTTQNGFKKNDRNTTFDKGMEETVGFITELMVYKKLCAEHPKATVNWVSENAFRFNPKKFPTSEAGKGYDMELTIGSKTRYIEVKGCKNVSVGIKMSKQEMKVALDNPNIYDLMIVENPLSDSPILRHIEGAFKFNTSTKPPQTLFHNDKLKVSNDNYLIQFDWKEI